MIDARFLISFSREMSMSNSSLDPTLPSVGKTITASNYHYEIIDDLRAFDAFFSPLQMRDEAQKELNQARQEEGAKLMKMKMAEEKRMKEMLEKQEQMAKPPTPPPPVDTDTSRLLEIEKKQRAEIARLLKELDRTQKTWQMKANILQNNIHALKDEMFLRSSLQRQSAKIQHAAIAYAVSRFTFSCMVHVFYQNGEFIEA